MRALTLPFLALALALTPIAAPAQTAPPAAASPPPPPPLPRCAEDSEGAACAWGRAEAFDAGSLQLHGLPVALIGITAPSHKDLCGSRASREEFDCARLAKRRMAELVRNGVACELLDISGSQAWGRCRTVEGDLGRLLVQAGVARAAKDGPYEESQLQAITAKRGLWANDVILPRDWDNARHKALDKD